MGTRHSITHCLILLALLSMGLGCNSDSGVDEIVQAATVMVPSDKGNESLVFQLSDRDFGITLLGSTTTEKRINLSNASGFNLYFSPITQESSHFEITSSTCPTSPNPFPPEKDCDLNVVFKPTEAGNLSTSIVVSFGTSIPERNSSASVVLTGVGASPIVFDGIDRIIEVTTTSLQLKWNAVENASNFVVYRVESDESLLPVATAEGSATGITITGLSPSTPYRFRVNGYDNYGGMDENTKVVEATTDDLGVFEPPNLSGGTEGATLLTNLDCHDAEFNSSTLSILQQSDSVAGAAGGAGCTIENSYQLQCVVPYKSSHDAWSAQVEVQCLINGSTLKQTVSLTLNDSNRAPRLAPVASYLASYPTNSAILAGLSTISLDFNGVTAAPTYTSLGDTDEDGDSLTYSCKYQPGTAQGDVQGAFVTDCAGVPNASYSFNTSTGAFIWQPRYADGNKHFAFQITATENGVAPALSASTSFIAKVNFAGSPMLTFSPSNLNFGTVASGATAQLSTTVTNASQTVAVIAGALSGIATPFSLVSHDCNGSLLPAQTCQITLQYAPTTSESQSGSGVLTYGSETGVTDATSSLPLIGYTSPAAPSNFHAVADAGGTSFTLSWSDNSSVESGLEIQRCDGAACATVFTAATTLTISTASTTSVGWAGLTEGNVYRFRIRAVRGATSSAWVTDDTQVLFGGITTVSNPISDSVTLNWTSIANAGTYVVTNVITGTPVVISNVSGPASSVQLTGLTALTLYKFRVNVVRGDGIGDTNVDDRNTTTSDATAVHLGWAHVQALGARVAAVQVPSDDPLRALDASARVTLTWNAMTVGGGSLQYYAIYRATSSSGQDFAAAPVGTTVNGSTTTYTDTTVTGKTTYYYVVRPVIAGAAVATLAADSEIKVMVPPDNMALVHRWMANQEICGLMGRTSDRANNYRCPYTGPTSVNDNGTYYYDFSKHLFVDRFEGGCNYTYSASGNKCGNAYGCIGRVPDSVVTAGSLPHSPPAAVLAAANTGDVYYDRYAAACWIKSAGIWKLADNATLSDTEQALVYSNAPGLPPIPRIFSTPSAQLCASTNITPFGTKRLPSRREHVVYGAWDSSLSDAQITALEYTAGTSLNTTGRCHTSYAAGHGLTFEDAEYPSSTTDINKMDALPGTGSAALPPGSVAGPTMSYNDNGWKAVRTGSYATRNCVSRYGVQDAVGNMPDQVADSYIKTVGGYNDGDITFTTNYRNGAERISSDLTDKKTDGTSLGNIGGATNGSGIKTFATIARFLPAIGFPVETTDPAGLDSIPVNASGAVGSFDPARFHGDNLSFWTWFAASGELEGGGGYYLHNGTTAGRWSVAATSTGVDTIFSAQRGFRCVLDAE
ncbi:fibronectin type III domain-containing protein [Bdellovibrionota bacterium FG-1]